jgi:hypothetical protein
MKYDFVLDDFMVENADGQRLWVERDSNDEDDGGNQYQIIMDTECCQYSSSSEFSFDNEAQAREFMQKFSALLDCNKSATEINSTE